MTVSGDWTIAINSAIGTRMSEATLNQDGTTLEGSMMLEGRIQPIRNGKADGNAVSWEVDVTAPYPMTLSFSGTVAGAAMAGQGKAGGFGSFNWSGTRVD
jgi:hypothetical protein